MPEPTTIPAKPATGMVRIAKDLADALAIIAQARDCTVPEVIDQVCRKQIADAYQKACKALQKAAPLPGHAPDLGENGGG